jgi:hypothetical protein
VSTSSVGQERKRLGVRLLTPEGPVFDDLAYMVIAPSVEGEVGILPRHTPFIAFLRTGETRIKLLDDTELVYATTEGYLSVEEDRVQILSEQAELAGGSRAGPGGTRRRRRRGRARGRGGRHPARREPPEGR